MTGNNTAHAPRPANALIDETSPYLLQHAYNPVAWQPWSEETLRRAKTENKPILLSIGYSACHWCHVMAHESFEDEETARLMNEHFINIKIDREERPDLDRIYQHAQYMLTGHSGGWPLTMFLTPDDQVPFFGGTYFPPVARHGLPGFKDLLLRVAEFYRTEHDAIRRQNTAVVRALRSARFPEPDAAAAELNQEPLLAGVAELRDAFDAVHGGFGGAPKFPAPTTITRLLHHHELRLRGGEEALRMALHTLKQMAAGGIYDQLGGGFCRYSVDERWLIPHFEKMLYDNGLLLSVYADAWQLSHEAIFKKVVLETAGWLTREMQSPEGGFYSSLDADSEGAEGRFYLWTPDAARAALNPDEYALIARHFALDQPANFEGHWHLYLRQPLETIAAGAGLDPVRAAAILEGARGKLLRERDSRIRPGRDDKILTGWNALAVKGLVQAAIRFDRNDFSRSAEKAMGFIHGRLWRQGRLLVTHKDGRSRLNAYLDDYAYLLDAILSLLQQRWSDRWFAFAVQLADAAIDHFYDPDSHGFFFTSHDHEALIQRRKDYLDDATPAGNGVLVQSLAVLGYLIDESRYVDAAQRTLRAAWGVMTRAPSGCHALQLALADYLYPPRQIVLRGDAQAIDIWRRRLLECAGIRTRIYAIPEDARNLPASLARRTAQGAATAYLCEGFQCRAPYRDLDELIGVLKNSG
jgi:hypothetical protein